MGKHIAVPPLGILRVSQRHPFRIPAVPSVFGRLDLFESGFSSVLLWDGGMDLRTDVLHQRSNAGNLERGKNA